jgi:hypothetical protein
MRIEGFAQRLGEFFIVGADGEVQRAAHGSHRVGLTAGLAVHCAEQGEALQFLAVAELHGFL